MRCHFARKHTQPMADLCPNSRYVRLYPYALEMRVKPFKGGSFKVEVRGWKRERTELEREILEGLKQLKHHDHREKKGLNAMEKSHDLLNVYCFSLALLQYLRLPF